MFSPIVGAEGVNQLRYFSASAGSGSRNFQIFVGGTRASVRG
jgi:hypothetical protein